MIPLIIISSILFVVLCLTMWILVLVVRRNEDLKEEIAEKSGQIAYLEDQAQVDFLNIDAKNDIIMSMEAGAAVLHLEHERAVGVLERIIGKLLLKQDGIVEDIAGGGGSADPEDEHEHEDEETPTPLRLVTDG